MVDVYAKAKAEMDKNYNVCDDYIKWRNKHFELVAMEEFLQPALLSMNTPPLKRLEAFTMMETISSEKLKVTNELKRHVKQEK